MAASDTQALLLRVSFGMLVAGIIDSSLRSSPRKSVSGLFIPSILLGVLAGGWLGYVNRIAPLPYLDEVFHIPQAQKYCDGKYYDWDDKITTPPGLYLISLFYYKVKAAASCTAANLRGGNVVAIVMTSTLSILCRNLIEGEDKRARGAPLYQLHTGLNIALFPVLFFFSGLYYTDVYSTVVVLLAYYTHLSRVSAPKPSISSDVGTILVGVASLLMRQTNVFWVVVYMGGLEVFHSVKTMKPAPVDKPELNTLTQVIRHYAWRYSLGEIHDPPLNIAFIDDWFFCVLSVGIAAISNPFRVLRQVWPHITVLGLFASFVYWNDGVVLGDKSNHVATIHLAQMLYIWPMFAFFSAPLLIPSLVPFLSVFRSIIGNIMRSSGQTPSSQGSGQPLEQTSSNSGGYSKSSRTGSSRKRTSRSSAPSRPAKAPPAQEQSWAFTRTRSFFNSKLFYLPYYLGTFALSFLVVRYNTIIHPFTLADNRHYMFYIFRYTILRSPAMRYMLIPAYTVSRWLCWRALSGCWFNSFLPQAPECPVSRQSSSPTAFYNRPFPEPLLFAPSARPPVDDKEEAEAEPPARLVQTLDDAACRAAAPPPTSTALLWLLTTALSLVTAPLVEPRYFILPWVFWRLLVPGWPAHACAEPPDLAHRLDRVRGLGWLFAVGRRADLRLVLETAWFLLINMGTMYVFLTRPFLWKAEDGTLLDGGRVQRFMW